ncbi:MAG: radical SAM protein [Firmicutes bacterium]|nr:radical SAM protein [Bacillota bacterium]MBQ3198996.1 radical SAM protein [Bacillota bacterium]
MLKQLLYMPWWFFRARILGQKRPLQTVLFVSNICNLRCKHCAERGHAGGISKTYEQLKEEMLYAYGLGSRFIDFEGGEPTIWRDGSHDLNSLMALARQIGFYTCTVTTNAQLPIDNLQADSIWVSLDGVGKYHDMIRGEGAFARLEKNIAASGQPNLSVNMAINRLNAASVEETIEYVAQNPAIQQISLNFHTPYPGTEHMALPWEQRVQIIDRIIDYKKRGYPIMNSVSGLKLMKTNDFPKECWVSNFILADGTRLTECAGRTAGVCDECGFCMAGEMHSVMTLKPDTILAGLKLRLPAKK